MKQNRFLVIFITGLLLLGAVHAVSANNTASFSPESPLVYIGDTTEISIVFDEIAPEGFAGCEFNITLSNPDAAILIEDVTFPAWATNHLNVLYGDDDLFVSVCDGANEIQPGNTDVTLITFSLKGIANGSTDISIVNPNFDNMPLGNNIAMTLNGASASVTERMPDMIVDAAGSGDYTTITDAVDNANANAWILVKPGVYSEAVVLFDALTITSSDGATDTILDADRSTGFLVYSDGVEISGFTIRNAEPALYLRSADCTVTGCSIIDNTQGIRLRGAENCRIYQNDFMNNAENVVVSTAGLSNTWHSPEMVSYSYVAQNFCNYLGNYWGSSGMDSNGDGLIDAPVVIEAGVNEDSYALAKPTAAYTGELPALPVAEFTADVTTGTAPLTVRFTDTSSGEIDSYAWDFDNDGTIDSTANSPVHCYETAGTYTVSLTVTNRGGPSTAEKADYISVSPEISHITFDPVSREISSGEDAVYTITLNHAPAGLSGYNMTVSLSDPLIGEISAVNLPSWSAMSDTGNVPASSVWIKGSDLSKKVQPGATDVLLASITVTGLSAGSADISLDVTRMDDDDGYPLIPDAGTAQLTVTPSVSLGIIPLSAGWNMISFPFSNAELTIPEGVHETVYVYDPQSQVYVSTTINTLEPGKGYWVAAPNDCTITVSGTPVVNYTADLRQGWNLIGSACSNLSFADLKMTPADTVPGYVYAYDPATQRYAQTTTLSPCGGYWMLAFSDCVMNVTSVPSP
ncbi:NosD domain-containing protein [Methanogenium cariaci]